MYGVNISKEMYVTWLTFKANNIKLTQKKSDDHTNAEYFIVPHQSILP